MKAYLIVMFVFFIIQAISTLNIKARRPREALSEGFLFCMFLLRVGLAIWTGMILFSHG